MILIDSQTCFFRLCSLYGVEKNDLFIIKNNVVHTLQMNESLLHVLRTTFFYLWFDNFLKK